MFDISKLETIHWILIFVLIGGIIYYFYTHYTFACTMTKKEKKVEQKPEETKEPFEGNVQTNNVLLEGQKVPTVVNYYATWCGWSQKFLPVWKDFEMACKVGGKPINVISIACDKGNDEMCSVKGIRGFPTVKLYDEKGVELKEFKGERTVDGLNAFIN